MEFDVAIIGGGPGGSSTAIRLQELGFRVLLLEKDRFPREKLCGEFLSPEALRLAVSLGVESELLAAMPARLDFVRLHFYGKPPLHIPLPEPALGVSRALLDDVLLRRAARLGAQVLEQTTAESVCRPSGEFSVVYRKNGRQEVAAVRAVICAAGRWNRLVTPSHGDGAGRAQRGRIAYGFKAHYESSVAAPNTLDLHFFPGGYCGVSHVENDCANVCCLIEKNLLQESHTTGADPSAILLRETCLGNQLLRGKRVSDYLFTGPLLFNSPRPVHDSMFMVGDSAGFIDPFCGDGISIAMHSGVLAAESLQPMFEEKCPLEGALKDYGLAYQRAFRKQFFRSRWLRAVVGSPRATRLAARAAQRSDWLRRQLFIGTRPNVGALTSSQR